MKLKLNILFKIFFIVMALIAVTFSASEVSAMEGDDASAIEAQIEATYKEARRRRGASFDGACGSYVNYQMLILGINTSYVRGNGNEEYGNYCNKTESSGGYDITAYAASKNERSLKTVLNKITNNGTKDAYNILVGFTRGSGSSDGQTYGHTFFIHAIIDGVCYYSESFGSIYAKEGGVTRLTIDEIANRYPDDGTRYHLDGVIHFHKTCSTRVSGATRYETALSSMKEYMELKGLSKVDSLIVANGINFPDALSGAYLSALNSAPILLVGSIPDELGVYPGQIILLAAILEYLDEEGTVYILGGENAVPLEIENTIFLLTGNEPVRLCGNDRYETSLKILGEAGDLSGQELIICSGNGFADALSASSLGRPILLVDPGATELTEAQSEFIGSSDFKKIYILGGTSAVSSGLAESIKTVFGSAPSRVSGKNRYETSVNVAKTFFGAVTEVVITCGTNFPDGLTGGLLSYGMNCPMLLTEDGNSAKTTIRAYIREKSINDFTILGGSGSVPYSVLEGISE